MNDASLPEWIGRKVYLPDDGEIIEIYLGIFDGIELWCRYQFFNWQNPAYKMGKIRFTAYRVQPWRCQCVPDVYSIKPKHIRKLALST